jgi:hypothetical protein
MKQQNKQTSKQSQRGLFIYFMEQIAGICLFNSNWFKINMGKVAEDKIWFPQMDWK